MLSQPRSNSVSARCTRTSLLSASSGSSDVTCSNRRSTTGPKHCARSASRRRDVASMAARHRISNEDIVSPKPSSSSLLVCAQTAASAVSIGICCCATSSAMILNCVSANNLAGCVAWKSRHREAVSTAWNMPSRTSKELCPRGWMRARDASAPRSLISRRSLVWTPVKDCSCRTVKCLSRIEAYLRATETSIVGIDWNEQEVQHRHSWRCQGHFPAAPNTWPRGEKSELRQAIHAALNSNT
mmetsp:Transcript_44222/g.84969  ORF Transcript_44222/g.84969 Transcript_44222/m.84969 type:complete len:242 (+) Transcript_44222:1127-1852(+)